MTYHKAELVQAVDDVEHGALPSLIQVGRLEECRLRHAKVPRGVVEVLDVGHRHKAACSFRLECRRRKARERAQLIDESQDKTSKKVLLI